MNYIKEPKTKYCGKIGSGKTINMKEPEIKDNERLGSGKEVTLKELITNALRLKPRELIIENPLDINLTRYETVCEEVSKNKKRFVRKKSDRIVVMDEGHLLFSTLHSKIL